ncbi:hypothetical protein [Phenylobacterium sp.]|uniref:phage nozzle protein n=1 Tax=Phenylobacterium sp. TaxID=1871053 RepID=UPI002737898C|nr:hypothetical protein [Phenylobacterium sp.]MDP3869927.1 hypothetical protein [Phenylobacterium sp.]
MSLVTQSINSLVNGVSQQPAILRLQSQNEAQVNCLSSAVDGVRRRPPTVHAARVATGNFASAGFHLINRDAAEKYAVILTDGDLRAFDLKTGAEKAVAFPDGKGYLAAPTPRHSFKAVTVADYTYLVNRTVATGLTADRAPLRNPEALLFFRTAEYREQFTLKINEQTWVMQTPKSFAEDTSRLFIQTDTLAAHMAALLVGETSSFVADGGNGINIVTNGGVATGFLVTRQGSVIHIYREDGSDFTMSVSAGGGGDHLVGIKGTIPRFTDLPRDGIDGFTVKVQGDPESDAGAYYVQYQKAIVTTPTAPAPVGGATGGTSGGDGEYPGVTPGGDGTGWGGDTSYDWNNPRFDLP